jgi:hypothetical protein
MARTVVAEAKPRSDAYTGMLVISLLVMLVVSVMMYMEVNRLGDPPAKLTIDVPGAAKAGATK